MWDKKTVQLVKRCKALNETETKTPQNNFITKRPLLLVVEVVVVVPASRASEV